MTTAASKGGDAVLPPRLSGKQKVVYFATSSSSASKSIFGETAFTGAPAGTAATGKVYLSVRAGGEGVFICFSTGSTTVSATTGWPIAAGETQGFWINAGVDTYISYITASGTGTIFWYVSSPEFEKPNEVV
jgi:hypothetical protein